MLFHKKIKQRTINYLQLKTAQTHFVLLTLHICISIEPCHEIIVLFLLCKLILQTCMRSHPVGLDVWFLVRPFYFHTYVRTAKAPERLRGCTGSPEPLLVAYVVSTIISWTGSIICIWLYVADRMSHLWSTSVIQNIPNNQEVPMDDFGKFQPHQTADDIVVITSGL